MLQQAEREREQKISPKPADHYLVGIGASAGGLEAIHKLFDHIPGNSRFAFVIIQHLSPDHKSLMAELLSKHTSMEVKEAQDNTYTRPNCVYVLPSGKVLSLQNGRLRLTEKPRNREPNFAIDSFFESLAVDRGPFGIGVVLSGTGTDGSKGIKAIKKAGGLVVVQDPESAKFDGMPRSAIDTGSVDFVLSPENMPHEILEYTRRIPLLKNILANGTKQSAPETDEGALKEILDLVCTHTKVDFSQYKQPTLNRRIQKRMQMLKLEGMREYLTYLHENPAEIKILCQDFFINVTSFFRDPEAFRLLEEDVIPKIIESKKETGDVIKVWVAACSTGEEVYSLAILFLEAFQKLGRHIEVKLFATDIDQQALQKASKGQYPGSIRKHVSEERLQRFFQKTGSRYQVSDEIRKMVIFAQHDLQKDPPYSKIDLVTCRNMLIYLTPTLQHKVLSLFPYALNMGGFLMLGPSENIGDLQEYFKEDDRKWKLYHKVKERGSLHRSYGVTNYNTASMQSQASQVKTAQLNKYNEVFMDALAEDFKVTALYVDNNYQLLHGIGDINRFLKFPDKRLHFNLIKMVPEELAVVLSVGIRKVIKEQINVVGRQVTVKFGNEERLIHSSIRSVVFEKGQTPVILVLLQELGEVNPQPKLTELPHISDSDYYQQLTSLEAELRETRDNLQMTVQDLSTTNEELQSSNEELMSSNEELQSSNEEMQSLNEELHTVNSEHQLKIAELQELNEDMDNYFRSTNVGQLFVDHNLDIRKYTPSVEQLVNIIGGDIGRPVFHLSHNLKYARLFDDIRHVNNTSQEIEQEVETTNGQYFLMRIMPYLKRDGNKDGVVISFVDVTTLKTLTSVVQGVLDSSLNSIMAMKADRHEENQIKDFRWTLLNKKAEEMLGESSANLIQASATNTAPVLRDSGLFRKFVNVAETGKALHIEQLLTFGEKKAWYEIAAVRMGDGITVTMADITDKKQSEDQMLQAYEELKKAEENLTSLNTKLERLVGDRTRELAASEERFRLVSMATNDVIWDWDLASDGIWWSDGLKKMLGYEETEMVNGLDSWLSKLHPDDRESVEESLNEAINKGTEQWVAEYRIQHEEGYYIFVSNRAYVLYNEYNMPYRMIGSFIDLSDLKLAQEELQHTNKHLMRVIDDLDTFVYTASHDLKSPIANIEGLVTVLEEQIGRIEHIPGEPTEPLFDMIKESIARFKNVIRDLTDIAKIQRDVDGEAEALELQQVYQNVYDELKEEALRKHATIEVDFSAASSLNFSRKNLHSIFHNLLSNALKYSSPDRAPHIKVSSRKQGKYVELSIEDNGLGISKSNQGKMFTLFKRFHSHVEGTGMGLYIVKRIMDNSGGKVYVKSDADHGTTFTLYFPMKSVS